MNQNPIPLEVEDPELAEMLVEICEYNSKRAKKDRIVVDFETGNVYERTRKVVKVGRNDPCPCGSNKKFKKCCGA